MRHVLTNNLSRVLTDVDIKPAMLNISANLALFDFNTARADFKGSPHKDTKGINCRLPVSLADDFTTTDALAAIESDICELECADTDSYILLPEVYRLVCILVSVVNAERIGQVLVTALKPGGHIIPHIDGGKYCAYYDRFHIVLSGNGSHFRVGDNIDVMLPGEVWHILNTIEHETWNDSDQPRVHLIVDLKLRGDKCLQ